MVELAKKRISLTLKQKSEWMGHFEENKAIALDLSSTINAADRKIDAMVYELYDFTPAEIALIENTQSSSAEALSSAG